MTETINPQLCEAKALKALIPGLLAESAVTDDGRLLVDLQENCPRLAGFLDVLRHQAEHHRPWMPEDSATRFPLRLNVVMHVVGSRGDVQPFIALGQELQKHGHRVRLATHLVFRDFVRAHDLEFFNIGGDPAQLMSFMVKNPNLVPKVEAITQGDISRRRKDVREILGGCWRSCFEPGEGIHPFNPAECTGAPPFVADAIIANPPSFAHIHCAEKMGIPLHLMFTMPWSPTQAFSHPLAKVRSTNTKSSVGKLMSYMIAETVIWQGVGDLINEFRRHELGLERLDSMRAPSLLSRLRIPFTYLWSPSLLPKPDDWLDHIDVVGFSFVPHDDKYEPPQDLVDFLEAGPPPIYIGFGSIVVDDPEALTQTILEAVRMSGQRAVVSKGWGNIGADEADDPNVYFLGNCPHDWLFSRVSCVVHHGGAGTTATGLALGRPTVIVPFFGDQPFWGMLVASNGAGPAPIPSKLLTADKLAGAIRHCMEPEIKEQAKVLSCKIQTEQGAAAAMESFHKHLSLNRLRCALCPDRPAVWRVQHTSIFLSAFAAAVLVHSKQLDPKNIKLLRIKSYDTNLDPGVPGLPGAEMFAGSLTNFFTGLVEMPVQLVQNFARSRSIRFAERYSLSSYCATQAPAPPSRSTTLTDKPETRQRSDSGISIVPSSNSLKSSSSQSSLDMPAMNRGTASVSNILINSGYTGRQLLDWIIEIPMSVTFILCHTFHNAPRFYHDQTVREAPIATGVKSGFVAAGQEFVYSWYDGITGVVTQPHQGWDSQGAPGLASGVGKGIGGLLIKPQAGLWGLLGYPLNGIHRSIANSYGKNRRCCVVKSRIAQGIAELQLASDGQRAAVLARWKDHYEQKVKAKLEKRDR
ncbi:UDP-Glycosyltransferase/glycogen phosphorylase [Aspergillus uvarum CBS 121591]|uniref:UDP-Glycosyltransferase/glycogen phosphorylase n=1 Tax=Aspergillus uvarum CBS 121591 TaxID=1448315 RepID=A0A319C4L4_9EURO|nr:UDP-Glycosyltransferase/glycogen phosphorylase [Aspergillus uvarum CBS 121591]PYH78799.1 UDP-Glycosyltransferase/glycogen phosphorylase [Aspergillus uvarum CBS 121591]